MIEWVWFNECVHVCDCTCMCVCVCMRLNELYVCVCVCVCDGGSVCIKWLLILCMFRQVCMCPVNFTQFMSQGKQFDYNIYIPAHALKPSLRLCMRQHQLIIKLTTSWLHSNTSWLHNKMTYGPWIFHHILLNSLAECGAREWEYPHFSDQFLLWSKIAVPKYIPQVGHSHPSTPRHSPGCGQTTLNTYKVQIKTQPWYYGLC